VVGEQAPAVAAGGVVPPDERVVLAIAVDVALGHRPGGVIFGDQLVAVVDELGRPRAPAGYPPQPPIGIVGKRDPARAGHQPVLGVGDAAAGPVRGEVAVQVKGAAARRGGDRLRRQPVERVIGISQDCAVALP